MRFVKNQANDFYLTLSEDSVMNSFVFEFVQSDNKKKYCVANRTYPGTTPRIDYIVIIDIVNPDNLNAEVDLQVGDCVLNIYEQIGVGLSPLGNKIESILVRVIDSVTTKPVYDRTVEKEIYNG